MTEYDELLKDIRTFSTYVASFAELEHADQEAVASEAGMSVEAVAASKYPKQVVFARFSNDERLRALAAVDEKTIHSYLPDMLMPKLVVRQDENPMDPRTENENLGTMLLYHSRYTLGDKGGGGQTQRTRFCNR